MTGSVNYASGAQTSRLPTGQLGLVGAPTWECCHLCGSVCAFGPVGEVEGDAQTKRSARRGPLGAVLPPFAPRSSPAPNSSEEPPAVVPVPHSSAGGTRSRDLGSGGITSFLCKERREERSTNCGAGERPWVSMALHSSGPERLRGNA